MRWIILVALTVMAGAQPASAQTDNAVPMALPDTNGADPDLACFIALASAAANANGKSAEMWGSAAGYYVGRLMTRLPGPEALNDRVAKLKAVFPAAGMGGFKLPCLQRYGVTLGIVQDALKTVGNGVNK